MKQYYVYILASKKHGVLYIGVTSELIGRTWQHKEGVAEGFSKRYWVKRLVYFEVYDEVEQAILREKRLKKWNREWKILLIEEKNPEWRDLYEDMVL